MKKIISAAQTRDTDQYTIENEPIPSIDLIERASLAFVNKFMDLYEKSQAVIVISGSGNNGGDGLAVARLLSERGYKVRAVLVRFGDSLTHDCQVNLERLNGQVIELLEGSTIPNFEEPIMIDAIFGSGLNRPVESWLKQLIEQINDFEKQVVSIDIPSGLMADDINEEACVIKAQQTITFQREKLSFLFPESGKFCGDLHVVDIGLNENFIQSLASKHFMLDLDDVTLPVRSNFDHKGTYGHLQVFAGSKGKMGAAHLAAKAALRSGVGLCSIHTAGCGLDVLQTNLPEAMVVDDKNENVISSGRILAKANAICVGPGIGTDPETILWFEEFLEHLKKPAVLDADAINIIGQNQYLMDFLPKGTILTPHLKELERMIGESANGLDRLEKVKKLTERYGIYILIKGAYSAIVTPQSEVFFNPTGNPGMATAGSGDVLAGIIGSLLAQGLSSKQALISSVYLHGLAGDIAKKELGEPSIMASDLLNNLPKSISNVGVA